ncbi:MAG: FixH family protein [Rhizobiaceae bacterium]|nr:FixH family protein [Rhizobiaceae bacterium]
MRTRQEPAPFTGLHMLLVMIAFFGVIIGVNVTMAMFARSSWTGLVVENSYVASQEFNSKMAETRNQAALGWKSVLSVREGRASYTLHNQNDRPVRLGSVTLKFMRPVDDREDKVVPLEAGTDGVYSSGWTVADGVWLVEVHAEAGLDHPYRETFRIHVAGGNKS